MCKISSLFVLIVSVWTLPADCQKHNHNDLPEDEEGREYFESHNPYSEEWNAPRPLRTEYAYNPHPSPEEPEPSARQEVKNMNYRDPNVEFGISDDAEDEYPVYIPNPNSDDVTNLAMWKPSRNVLPTDIQFGQSSLGYVHSGEGRRLAYTQTPGRNVIPTNTYIGESSLGFGDSGKGQRLAYKEAPGRNVLPTNTYLGESSLDIDDSGEGRRPAYTQTPGRNVLPINTYIQEQSLGLGDSRKGRRPAYTQTPGRNVLPTGIYIADTSLSYGDSGEEQIPAYTQTPGRTFGTSRNKNRSRKGIKGLLKHIRRNFF